ANLSAVANALRETGIEPTSQQLLSVPQDPSVIDDLKAAKQALRLYELLDDYEDTMNVFTNFEVSDAVLAQLED
ncbi:MAG: YebC/PmpR family DNA-binding transcriptional regulator, partial [Roseibacillus sp.]